MWPDRRIIDLFKTEFPIVLGPMAGVMDAELATAVAQGGGVASLPCAMITPDKAREQVHIFRQRVSAPINLNFFCHKAVDADPAREAIWRQRLAPYYREHGLDPNAQINAANRAPFDAAFCAVVEELKPEIVSFHFGLPEPKLLERVKATGAVILSSATTVKEAIWLEENGADVIIAQGAEAGGHRGMFLTENIAEQPGTFALVPQVVDAVRVPVIAAGGIADGARDRGGVRARRIRCADRHRLFALPGVQGHSGGAGDAGAGERRIDRHHQCDDRPPGARRRQPSDARGRADLARRASVPARSDRPRTVEGGCRKAGQGRFHQSVGRAGGADGQGNAGGRVDAGAGRRRAGADGDSVSGLTRELFQTRQAT
ncbi:hypothetical protein ABIF23_002703 [Bradyrhizobium elkanii]